MKHISMLGLAAVVSAGLIAQNFSVSRNQAGTYCEKTSAEYATKITERDKNTPGGVNVYILPDETGIDAKSIAEKLQKAFIAKYDVRFRDLPPEAGGFKVMYMLTPK